jgi:membrane-associated protein
VNFVFELYRNLTTPESLVVLLSTAFSGWWGYALLFAIVFCETGLLFGFFLPGDSLLFTVGVVAGAGELNLAIIVVTLVLAAVVGDGVGYLLGRHIGVRIFNRRDSLFFKRRHLLRAQAYYEKHGGKTIVYARFVPIVRTFAPFLAGVVGMNYRKFVVLNVTGAVLWVLLLTMAGNFLGSVPVVRVHFEKVIFAVILLSLLPFAFESMRQLRREGAKTRS